MELAQKAWKRLKDYRMLELEAIIKANSPYLHFANFSDAERSFELSTQVHWGKWESRNSKWAS